MQTHDYRNKKFNTTLPLVKAEVEEDGYYYLTFGLSTTTVDLENEQVTPECLDDMIEQAKVINSVQVHQYGLDDIIGPIVDSWKEAQNQAQIMYVKVRVVPSLKDKIKELVDAGVRLGGSIGGIYMKDRMQNGIRLLEKVKLLEASLTPLPVNWDTLGTAMEAEKSCPNGLCGQIFKSIQAKYFKEMEDDNVKKSKSESDSYEGLRAKVDAAVRDTYTQDGYGVWVKLTFPDSVIIEDYNEDKLYEIPYTINGDGEVELGERTEVEEQYVEKKLQLFRENFLEANTMDKKEFQTFKDEMLTAQREQNDELIEAIKGLNTPMDSTVEAEKPGEPLEAKTLDETVLVEKVTKGVLKALGIEHPVEEKETEKGSVVILNSKDLEDLQSEMITKTILEIAKQRKGTRKSNPLGGDKFVMPGAAEERDDTPTQSEGRKSISQIAEGIIKRNPMRVA